MTFIFIYLLLLSFLCILYNYNLVANDFQDLIESDIEGTVS